MTILEQSVDRPGHIRGGMVSAVSVSVMCRKSCQGGRIVAAVREVPEGGAAECCVAKNTFEGKKLAELFPVHIASSRYSISLHPPNSSPCELLALRTSLGPEPWCDAAMVSRS